MPSLPAPLRAWLCTRLALRFGRILARALEGMAEGCRIEARLAPGAPDPSLPASWPAHHRIALLATIEDIRRRHALWIRLAGAERLVFALDVPQAPRLRLWAGRGTTGNQSGGSAFVIVPLRPRA